MHVPRVMREMLSGKVVLQVYGEALPTAPVSPYSLHSTGPGDQEVPARLPLPPHLAALAAPFWRNARPAPGADS